MSRKSTSLLLVISVIVISIFAGCGPDADLSLKFEPGQSQMYRVKTSMIKDFEFIQPSAGKEDIKKTGSEVEMIYSQNIKDVTQEGTATADIMIKELRYKLMSKDGVDVDFDSTDPGDSNNPLANAVGKSYTIKISPDGSVQLVNASAVTSAVRSGQEARIIKSLMSLQRVKARHQIAALPAEKKALSKNDTWTNEVQSPKGMLAQKKFKKVYTVESVKEKDGQRIAVVKMDANAGPAELGGEGMGFFAKMFDTNEDYTGKLVLNATTGNVIEYNEKLKATYIAMEPAEEQNSDKGPDTLTMGFTQTVELEMVE
jgi:hypothetical protein